MRRMTVTFVVIAIALSLTGCERYALDRQMEELCKKDGGVKVYETVTLSPQEYDEIFSYAATAKSREHYYGPEYRYVSKHEVLVGENAQPEKGEGRLSRAYVAIYRRSNDRLLGESVLYGRIGGDGFTFGFQPSTNLCPRRQRDLGRTVFLRRE